MKFLQIKKKLFELRFEILDDALVDLERLGEHIVGDARLRPEHGVGHRDDPRILAAEGGNGHCRRLPRVELEVHESHRKHEHVAPVQGLEEELVVRVGRHESDEEGTLDDCEDLGGARVGVRRVEAAGGVVDARQGDAERVQAGDSGGVDEGDVGADFVSCVASLV